MPSTFNYIWWRIIRPGGDAFANTNNGYKALKKGKKGKAVHYSLYAGARGSTAVRNLLNLLKKKKR